VGAAAGPRFEKIPPRIAHIAARAHRHQPGQVSKRTAISTSISLKGREAQTARSSGLRALAQSKLAACAGTERKIAHRIIVLGIKAEKTYRMHGTMPRDGTECNSFGTFVPY
jgi:hypothetical protein